MILVIEHQKDNQKKLVEKFLSESEEEVYKNFNNKRRKEWIFGRIAAKKAFLQYVNKSVGESFSEKDVEVHAGLHGRPEFVFHKPMRNVPDVSISHSGHLAVAAVSNKAKEGCVGIDIQEIKPFKKIVLDSFITSWEKDWLAHQDKKVQNMYITLIWTVKEAYIKCRGWGLSHRPKRIEFHPDNFQLYDDGKKVAAKIEHLFNIPGYVFTSVIIKNK